MKVYHYDKDNLYYKTTELDDSDKDPLNPSEFLIPAKCTTTSIPEIELKPFHKLQWDGSKWNEIIDYRDMEYFDKETKEEGERIKQLNVVIDFTKYALKKPKEDLIYQKYDEELDDWIEDIEAKTEAEKNYRIIQIKKELEKLDIKKMRYLIEKDKGDLSGKKYFDEYEAVTVKLRDELKSLEGLWEKKDDMQI